MGVYHVLPYEQICLCFSCRTQELELLGSMSWHSTRHEQDLWRFFTFVFAFFKILYEMPCVLSALMLFHRLLKKQKQLSFASAHSPVSDGQRGNNNKTSEVFHP